MLAQLHAEMEQIIQAPDQSLLNAGKLSVPWLYFQVVRLEGWIEFKLDLDDPAVVV